MVVHVINQCGARRRIEQQVIGMSIPVKIRSSNQAPASIEGWADRPADTNIVVHVINQCGVRRRIEQQVIRMPIPYVKPSRKAQDFPWQLWFCDFPADRAASAAFKFMV
jgi:hypothetical protein